MRYCEDEDFKGCTQEKENELIEAFRDDIRIKELAYINPAYGSIHESILWNIITRPDDINPFDEQVIIHTLSVRLIESIWHHVGVVTYEDEVYYCDPYRESWLKIENAEQLAEQFIDCCCIQRPVHKPSDAFASFDGRYLQYPFLKSQYTPPEHGRFNCNGDYIWPSGEKTPKKEIFKENE